MENWSLKESNGDSPSGFVDNMQLLWKLQSLMGTDQSESNSHSLSNNLNTSTSTNVLPDSEDLVDKLFRESFALQRNNETIQQEQQSANRSLELLLTSPAPIIDLTTFDEPTTLNMKTSQTIGKKRSRSPPPPSHQTLTSTQNKPQQQQGQLNQRPTPQQQQYYSQQRTLSQHSPINTYRQILPIASTPTNTINASQKLTHPSISKTSMIAPLPPYSTPRRILLTQKPRSSTINIPPPPSQLPIPATMIPRPQLRLHLKKYQESIDSPYFDDAQDPMKSNLDVASLRRLTIATLRTLGVYLSFDELPTVDIEDSVSTDSQQVLPAAAMQLITTMVLGTSGDKDVLQTIGSQISNGDLVALQRMIVSGLRSKNIVIHTVLPMLERNNASQKTKKSAKPTDKCIDLSHVTYAPPHNVTRLFLRLYRFILNMLLSTPDCWPFIQPVPQTAYLYHQEIKNPMDLYTIEENMWNGKYTKFAKFEKDIQLIWKNARSFHRNAGTISIHANNLEKLFTKIVIDIKKQIRKQQLAGGTYDFKFDPMHALPEESDFSYPPMDQVFSKDSAVYTISAISPFEPKGKRPKGMPKDKQLYLQLNGPFFQAVERMKFDLEGNHSIVPRFYIAKNRTLLRQIRSHGVLAIFYNLKTNRVRNSKNIHIETDIILAHPASELFEINECPDEFAPKGWIHLRPLRIMNGVSLEVNEPIERDYFKRMFATAKMVMDEKYDETTKVLLRNAVKKILNLSEETTTIAEKANLPKQLHKLRTKEEKATETNEGSDDEISIPASIAEEVDMSKNQERLGKQEIAHEVWQRLFNVCKSKGVVIRNMSAHGNINWSSPDSEGFFKRVYFFKDVVVQVFRQMTMYQRITEVACLMKLRNLPHMAQMKEVLYNDNGDITGLSIERYQTTLKQFAHVHSHHRLSAYQKYDVINQMLVCMKTIHEAGLAHRDLSEVNMMVNTVEGQFLDDGSEKVYLYLIDFGKAVFCESKDVREWFVDVPRAKWEYDGSVVPETKEELDTWCESLPWVRGKPDHGYRMYRSIQTLPKTRSDTQVLPWLIHPKAEDIYSIGVMIWKLFTDTEPWRGILDTDLQGLRYVAEDDYRIERALEGEVHGKLSRQLLLKCLKTRPEDRATAHEILDWINQEGMRERLIGEWEMYSSDSRGTRRSRNYGSNVPDDEERKRPRKRFNTGSNKQKSQVVKN